MRLSDFDYPLPEDLIAIHPADQRDRSRLLRLLEDASGIEHHRFADLPALLRPGDCLVVNDSRVIPARLFARRPGGGKVELLFTAPAGEDVWEALARPARKLIPGMKLDLPDGEGQVEILPGADARLRRVRLLVPEAPLDYLQRRGEMPLPPYILMQRKLRGESPHATGEDRERYQTVYAEPPGSIAAPTAGLHFTPALLEAIRARGIELRRVTLHVGLGTFLPIEQDDPTRHRMHVESFVIDEENAAAIEAARRAPDRRIVAVGTTTVRALETLVARHGRLRAGRATTDLFIYPGFRFRAIDALITNFHLPRSSLLMLVSAFAGRERILEAYREAIAQRYRFFSYGDAMLIERPPSIRPLAKN